MITRWSFGVVRDEALLLERLAQRRDDLARFLVIDLGKEVDVSSRQGDEAVRDHGSAPASVS